MEAKSKIPGSNISYGELLEAANLAMTRAYAPYSKFSVGAAALMSDGVTVFTGCNVENANFTVGHCAERTAFSKAISEGRRDFKAVAVVCQSAKDAWPCGLCRQFMAEFGEDISIIVEAGDGSIKELTMRELLPQRIEPKA